MDAPKIDCRMVAVMLVKAMRHIRNNKLDDCLNTLKAVIKHVKHVRDYYNPEPLKS